MRAVLDPNVLISSIISSAGPPARLIGEWRSGAFELIVSSALLSELERVMSYDRLRPFIDSEDAAEFMTILGDEATLAHDPDTPTSRATRDPDDEYLVLLARSEGAALVSGDRHLLELAESMPVYTPRAFLAVLDQQLPS